MIRFLYADELARFPVLEDSMFRDRATQFRDRLNWDVTVDAKGHEKDAYDAEGPLYVIWVQADGTHGGSMRILPTTGRTMVNDHFAHLNDGVRVESPLVWECTRFCLSPRLKGGFRAALPVSAALMMARAVLRAHQQGGQACCACAACRRPRSTASSTPRSMIPNTRSVAAWLAGAPAERPRSRG
jgi:N-acyl-L-homoserine lactone synthetase